MMDNKKTAEDILAERMREREAAMAEQRERRRDFAPAEHPAIALYENAPCYDPEQLTKMQRIGAEVMAAEERDVRLRLIDEFVRVRDSIRPIPDHPEPVELWPDGILPSVTEYTDNSDLRWNHDPDFRPFLYELLVPDSVEPKGLIIFCAGGDHGYSMYHEAYTSCLDFVEKGYQTLYLANRTNGCPWKAVDSAADASRAVRYARKNAGRLRIDPENIAFAGFSNGGVTGESCILYFSGKKKMTDYYEDYVPDELDMYYGAPDAFLCVYGPRYAGAEFDYTGVVYPPTFFAVGREDGALDNLNYVYPDLVSHGVKVEVHTFAGTPHGQAGVRILDGYVKYPNFELWIPLADHFLMDLFAKG